MTWQVRILKERTSSDDPRWDYRSRACIIGTISKAVHRRETERVGFSKEGDKQAATKKLRALVRETLKAISPATASPELVFGFENRLLNLSADVASHFLVRRAGGRAVGSNGQAEGVLQ